MGSRKSRGTCAERMASGLPTKVTSLEPPRPPPEPKLPLMKV